jgi:hypothetical protein
MRSEDRNPRIPSKESPERLATTSAADEDRELVADQLATATGKTGGRLVKHARYYWLLLAESGLTRRLFGAMVRRIAALPMATG